MATDIDSWMAARQGDWERLERLARRAGRRAGRLSGAEIDEMVSLHRQVSTHLSLARSRYADPALVARLTRLVARSGSVVYGTRSRTLRAMATFFTLAFPAAMWRARWAILASAGLFILPAAGVGIWIANSEAALAASGPAALREAYVNTEFEEYYSSAPAAAFSSQVFTNNVRVGFLAFAGGVAFCLVTVYVLILNGAGLGMAAGLFAAVDQSPRFYGLILPHGLLELTAVFVAGGAGLRLGWALIEPGDRRRSVALATEARRSVTIVLGLIAVFGVAGLIEGFVTGSPLPTWLRVGIGVAAETAFLSYVFIAGRAAAARGLTGGPEDELVLAHLSASTNR
ncbi:MAG: stage II sporulation protein M [Acidimicrobiales bacterium]